MEGSEHLEKEKVKNRQKKSGVEQDEAKKEAA